MYGEGLPNRGFRRGTTPLVDVEFKSTQVHDLTPETTIHLAGPGDHPPVPLPNEIPQPPNLSTLPVNVLHSGTVETLIAQNEDLMARLKVNLRRNALLEQRIFELEDVLGLTQQENEALKDQTLIVQEKDRMWKEKNSSLETKFDDMAEEIQFLRLKFNELEETSEQKIEVLQKYMRRVRRWVRPSLKNDRSRMSELMRHLEHLRKDLSARDIEVVELNARIEKLIRFEREREGLHQQDQARLVDGYETQLREKTELLEKLTSDINYFKERSQRLDEMTRKQIEAENRSILFERKSQELERRLSTEVHEFQTLAATYRGEAKSLAFELESLKAEMVREREERERVESENERLTDQLESLQTLWGESRKQTESLELRMESLNKINQELSRKLKEQRVETENAALNLKSPQPTLATAAAVHDIDKLNKLDALLATIESGFPIANSPEVARVRNLAIIEDPFEEKEPARDMPAL